MMVSRKQFSRFGLVLLGAAIATGLCSESNAQNRVDLDDLNIKGELLNDNRLRMSSRDQHKISDRVTYRDNFRKEITDGLEIAWPEDSGSRAPANQGTGGSQ